MDIEIRVYHDLLEDIARKIIYDLPCGGLGKRVMSGCRDIEILTPYCHVSARPVLAQTLVWIDSWSGGIFANDTQMPMDDQRQYLLEHNLAYVWFHLAYIKMIDPVEPFNLGMFCNPLTGGMLPDKIFDRMLRSRGIEGRSGELYRTTGRVRKVGHRYEIALQDGPVIECQIITQIIRETLDMGYAMTIAVMIAETEWEHEPQLVFQNTDLAMLSIPRGNDFSNYEKSYWSFDPRLLTKPNPYGKVMFDVFVSDTYDDIVLALLAS